MRWLALILTAALAGCAAPFASQADAPDSWQADRALFLHSTMTLAGAPEGEEHAIATEAFFQAWSAGADYPTWLLDPLERDALVTEATITLFVRATGPVVETARFPDIMVYLGAGDAWMGYGERRDLSAFAPGEVKELAFEVALPTGGLWVSPDAPLGIKVVPVMLQQEQASLEILMGAKRASGARLRVEPLDVARAGEIRDATRGELAGTAYAGPAAPPGTTQATAIEVAPAGSYLVAWMNTTQSTGVPDLDIVLVGPEGDEVASAGTPRPQEQIRVAGPSFVPGDYALVVSTAGAPRAAYSLEWRVGLS